MAQHNPVLCEPVGIIGAGVAGLINAHILLQDGFTNVTLITRDKTVGGTWTRERVYPGLFINNVHGEYRFSALDMPPPERSSSTGGRLTGQSLCQYMETFADRFLKSAHFRFETEVLDIKRTESCWRVRVRPQSQEGGEDTLTFSRIILATGGCSTPNIPDYLSPKAASKAGFRGVVFHTSTFSRHLEELLAAPPENGIPDEDETVLVIGGGKSAQDICAKLANEGRRVVIVFDKTDGFLASPRPLPDFIRKSRFLPVLMGHSTLRTRLERLLHQTWIGNKIVHFITNAIVESSYQAYNIPANSPLRNAHSLFWGIRLNDEGSVRADSYHSLVNNGAIKVVAPARAAGYAPDGNGVVLSDGRILKGKAVVLATGYQSSWSNIFTADMADEIGIARHAPTYEFADVWAYESLKGAPEPHSDIHKWTTSIYRGIVPAKNIERRDFAVAGANFTTNPGYSNEVATHWISSYFQRDKMRLPSSVEAAMADAERCSMWQRVRFPQMVSFVNESYSAALDFWTWPQMVDELLEDMYLPSQRSGGNWLTWVFKTVDIKEIESLGKERQALRDKINT